MDRIRYFMGIDNGSTSIKASLYDMKGNEVCTCSEDTPVILTEKFSERDMEQVWKANCMAIRNVIRNAGVDPSDIRGIACCGHGKGLYLWGDGKPVRNGITSSDNRAWEYPAKWEKDGTAGKVFDKTYQHILACQPVSLLAWMKDHEYEAFRQIRWIFECKDYIRFRITGEAYAELTDYSGANLVNLRTAGYDKELLSLFGLDDIFHKLPPLRKSYDVCGYVTEEAAVQTGLACGTPVAGGMFDIDACAVGVNAMSDDNACMIAGTWSINEYVSTTPILDGSVLMNSYFCIPGYYLVEECSPTSAGNNEWFVRNMLPEVAEAAERKGESVYACMDKMVSSVRPDEQLPIFIPFILGNYMHSPDAKGGFYGIEAHHTRAHLARAIYEGIVFSHRHHFERLAATRSMPFKEIKLAGGAARSQIWSQMFSDILQQKVVTTANAQAGTLGCAIAAAVSAGEFGDIYKAADAMVRTDREYVPDRSLKAIYDAKYKAYKELTMKLYNN